MSEKITKYDFVNRIEYRNEKDELHNINDEPAVVYDNPATIWPDGSKFWYKNGKRHRTKGPAAITSDGDEYWFYEDNDITEKVNQLMEDGKLDPDWRNWTEEDEFLFVLLIS